jgi:tRNA(fMet)-specific endonuclease VapC
MYLIDTNILSYLIKGNSQVQSRFIEMDEKIFLCSIVELEVYYGAKKVGRDDLIKSYNLIFETYTNLPLGSKEVQKFTDLKVQLEKTGMIVDTFDLLIASIALANNLTLVTNNTKHFKNIQGLKLEDWTK